MHGCRVEYQNVDDPALCKGRHAGAGIHDILDEWYYNFDSFDTIHFIWRMILSPGHYSSLQKDGTKQTRSTLNVCRWNMVKASFTEIEDLNAFKRAIKKGYVNCFM